MKIVLKGTVTDIFERKLNKWAGGTGKDAHFTTESAGWYVRISEFTIFVGNEKPLFKLGDPVRLVLERDNNA